MEKLVSGYDESLDRHGKGLLPLGEFRKLIPRPKYHMKMHFLGISMYGAWSHSNQYFVMVVEGIHLL